jgi:DNA-binding transcriptional LysR family regulator
MTDRTLDTLGRVEDLTPPPTPDGSFRVGFVPGVMPGKWERIWGERERRPLALVLTEVEDQAAHLRDGRLHMCFVRGEADREFDKAEFHLIPLYREQPVVVVGLEHPVAAYDEVDVGELADEHDVLVANPGLPVRYAVETVAAGTGIVILPMSLARLHHRKDAVWRPVTGVEEDYPVGLAWIKGRAGDEDEAAIQTFIGIVRGRGVNSSRG